MPGTVLGTFCLLISQILVPWFPAAVTVKVTTSDGNKPKPKQNKTGLRVAEKLAWLKRGIAGI